MQYVGNHKDPQGNLGGIFLFIFDILSVCFVSINHLTAIKLELRMPKL